MTLNIKRKFFLLLIFALVTWLAVGFIFHNIRSRQVQTADLIAEIALKYSIEEEIKTLSEQLKLLGSKIENVEQFFLPAGQDNLVSFIEIVESMATISAINLTINSIEVSEMTDDKYADDFENFNFKLKISGDWVQIYHFLNIVENLPYHTIISETKLDKNTNLSEQSEQSENPVWEGIINFSVIKKAN